MHCNDNHDNGDDADGGDSTCCVQLWHKTGPRPTPLTWSSWDDDDGETTNNEDEEGDDDDTDNDDEAGGKDLVIHR